jgi:hypothetical protein
VGCIQDQPHWSLSIPSMEDYNDEDPPCTDTFKEEGEFFVDIGLGLDDITSNDLDEVVDAREISELIKL